MQTQIENQSEVQATLYDSRKISAQPHTYRVGHINFIVTPVYPSNRGETMSAILLKLMNTDIENKK